MKEQIQNFADEEFSINDLFRFFYKIKGSSISGYGILMNIVRQNIENLGGEIEIQSKVVIKYDKNLLGIKVDDVVGNHNVFIKPLQWIQK